MSPHDDAISCSEELLEALTAREVDWARVRSLADAVVLLAGDANDDASGS